METFYQVFGFVAAICAGIIILAVFFTGLGYVKRAKRGFDIVKMKHFIKEGKLVNVHLNTGRIFTGLRFVGFTDASSSKDGVPFALSQMVVCETGNGARVFFKAEAVRVIEEIEDVA
ncbi:MAG: hypothetical protein HY043_02645 [Verrucomicrobia bacterium]|nr:hypothetical protein [Verrucomicrobiota bacterium]